MSLLTKAFVVVVTVLSVLLVALTVSFVANTNDAKEEAKKHESNFKGAQVRLRKLQSDIESMQSTESARIATLNGTVAELTATIAQQRRDIAESEARNKSMVSSLNEQKANVARLTATSNLSVTLLEKVNSELNDGRSQLVDTETKLVQAIDRINELETEREGLIRSLQHNKENAVALAEELEKIETAIASLPQDMQQQVYNTGEGTVKVKPSHQIVGQIDLVKAYGEVTMVQINVGKNDGVAENMEFMVHRGSEYVGTLIVTKVDARDAAGQLTLVNGAIQAGDTVLAGSF
ncbi:hypothetical protein [Poriferisphaera sp. WC338]|uniref:hypothetical protein n=1 Tax=Poriferisphaera sp. WC338 TaxID=3425129 RepID=UPI003D815999